ncbi:hypothetical protein [Enemella sp. A6]|uniref:hypothetical protein n=1 Tax=Enemella sp. A6 TaxID=3440152 RepID=UPI003EBB7760
MNQYPFHQMSPDEAEAMAQMQAMQQQYLQQYLGQVAPQAPGQMPAPAGQPAAMQPARAHVTPVPAASAQAAPPQPSMASEAGRFALDTVSEITGFKRLASAKGIASAGALFLVAGLFLAINNLRNSAGLLAGGESFWDTYFLVEHPVHAIQAYGSIILPILGVVLLIVALVRRSKR